MVLYRVSDVEQNTPEWLIERAKYVTGSVFHALLSQPQSKKDKEAGLLSASAESVLFSIVAAYDGGVKDDVKTRRLEQSHIDEEIAIVDYNFGYDTELIHSNSFIISNKYKYAALSPDGIHVDDSGDIIRGVEIKCLDVDNHTRVLSKDGGTGIDKKYLAQMEWYCFVLGVDKCVYYGYCDKLSKLKRYFFEYEMSDNRRTEIESIYLKFEEKVNDQLIKMKLV